MELLPTAWGRRGNSFRPLDEAIEDYNKVRCPKCGTIEKEPKIKVFGIFVLRPFLTVMVFLVIFMFVAIRFFHK
ncbi:hypothetical protein KFZ76_15130 [Methylovulum psychrotolerans]|uniref:hypothetical protein n=1 Tax=Methylovulum psychrotolerans TaxID=1704499 RepID=UPI001BFEFF88|nr:hypothetical protein [Methylovulum psychrotolerans]MBT9099032.1 hypothetical protein [Methylovulum psychrotolerans]